MEQPKRGRPTKYKEEFENQAFELCLLGLSDEQLAGYFHVDLATLNRWKQDHPNFCESIKAGKQDADAKVSKALYQSAIGYTHPETVFHVVSDGSNLGSSVVATETVKKYPPNERAARFWLTNRQRKNWTEKSEIGFTNKNGEDVQPFINLPTDALKALEQILTKADEDSNTGTDQQGGAA